MADTWRIMLAGIEYDMDSAADPDMLEDAYVHTLPRWAIIEPQDVRHLAEAFEEAIAARDGDWLATESLSLVAETYGFCVVDATIVLEVGREGKTSDLRVL